MTEIFRTKKMEEEIILSQFFDVSDGPSKVIIHLIQNTINLTNEKCDLHKLTRQKIMF